MPSPSSEQCAFGSSSYRAYAPRKPSPLAEGASTSPPSSASASSPNASPPESPKSLSFTDASTTSSTPSLLCPKPTHSKALPTRVQTVHRLSYSPNSGPSPFPSPSPAPAPASPHPHRLHRRPQSTSAPTLLANPVSAAIERDARHLSAPDTRVPLRPVRPSTSRVPEENWMTSESAPRFTRQSLVLGAVVLPVRKHDAEQAKRPSALHSGTPARYSTLPNTAVGATPAVSNAPRVRSMSETAVEKEPYGIPSVQVVDVDGTIQAVDELGVDLSKRDGAGTKKTTSLGHVRKFSRDFAAKMKIRSGQMKPMRTVTQEKAPDPGLLAKRAVEKEESGPDPRPSGAPWKRPRSVWGYVLGSGR